MALIEWHSVKNSGVQSKCQRHESLLLETRLPSVMRLLAETSFSPPKKDDSVG